MVKEQKKKVEITKDTPRVLVCVYGTLREGHHNWAYLLKNRATKLGTYKSEPGFTMYDTGGFPIVCDRGTGTIDYEVYEVTDDAVLANLHRLEGCTGIPGDERNWYDIQPIETPHGRAYMYLQHETMDGLDVIESGDWNSLF